MIPKHNRRRLIRNLTSDTRTRRDTASSALRPRSVPRLLVQPEPVLHDAVQVAPRRLRPLVGPVEVRLETEPVHVAGHDLEAEPGRGKAGKSPLPVTRESDDAKGRRSETGMRGRGEGAGGKPAQTFWSLAGRGGRDLGQRPRGLGDALGEDLALDVHLGGHGDPVGVRQHGMLRFEGIGGTLVRRGRGGARGVSFRVNTERVEIHEWVGLGHRSRTGHARCPG